MTDLVKLHIGGIQRKEGWKILNVVPGPSVDFVGSCTDLSLFGNDTVDEVYGSHILEHLDLSEIRLTLVEIQRVLKPGALFKGSVPDLEVLCRLYLEATESLIDQTYVMRMIYGGHMDQFDIHHFGFNMGLMAAMLAEARFSTIGRVENFGEFDDTSSKTYRGVPISLNFIAWK